MFGLFYIAGAQAVYDVGVFQLDRNAIVDLAESGEDWNKGLSDRHAGRDRTRLPGWDVKASVSSLMTRSHGERGG